MKKHIKRGSKGAVELTKFGIIGGVGSSALTKIGGTAATSGATGVSTMASYAPTMGTAMGAGMAMGMVKELAPKKRKRK